MVKSKYKQETQNYINKKIFLHIKKKLTETHNTYEQK